jgi:hypothetical protein
MTKILYRGGFWINNIGNALIDYASIYTIKKAVPDAAVYFNSGNRGDLDNPIDVAEFMEVDAIVVSGMVFCKSYLYPENRTPIVKKLSDRGVRIVFNGCGCETYDEVERKYFRKFLRTIENCYFISRDETTFENFKDCFSKSYNGIDCAFFLSNAFKHAPLAIKDYVVYTFCSMKEPKIENTRKIIRVNHHYGNFHHFYSTNTTNILAFGTKKPYIRIGKDANKLNRATFESKELMISDIPDDYLNLYANAYAVYSDMMHACIATLSFGNFARYYRNTPRFRVLQRVGAGEIRKKLVKLDQDKINREKENQLSFLREVLG